MGNTESIRIDDKCISFISAKYTNKQRRAIIANMKTITPIESVTGLYWTNDEYVQRTKREAICLAHDNFKIVGYYRWTNKHDFMYVLTVINPHSNEVEDKLFNLKYIDILQKHPLFH